MRQALRVSLRLRLVGVFVLLALAMVLIFAGGAQRAFSLGWRETAKPLVRDYVDHLVADIVPAPAGPPSIERALAVTQKLPLTVRIRGPVVNWQSHAIDEHSPHDAPFRKRARGPDEGDNNQPDNGPYNNRNDRNDRNDTQRSAQQSTSLGGQESASSRNKDKNRDSDRDNDHFGEFKGDWSPLLQRQTADGHTLTFGVDAPVFKSRFGVLLSTLGLLLLVTVLAYWRVWRLLSPLKPIQAGAARLGAGAFDQPIHAKLASRPDELGQLARTINTMGRDIHDMLEAKRALLLAISHELRSPLTRARLHTELLPETADLQPQRQALLGNLQEMATLINDLLESERLAGRHAALQRELLQPQALLELVQTVLQELAPRHAAAQTVQVHLNPALPAVMVDSTRLRLVLRNLLDNALRHGSKGAQAVQVSLQPVPAAPAFGQPAHHPTARDQPVAKQPLRNASADETWAADPARWQLQVRDHGPGVPQAVLASLASAFYRPDQARTRASGGVGLGLYLCKLVAQAHGGALTFCNAQPGLLATVTLPVEPLAAAGVQP